MKRSKKRLRLKITGDSLVASLKKTVEEHGDKVSAEEKTKIETGITDLEEALKGEDVEDIKNKTKSLTEASMKLGEAVYKDMQQQAQEQHKTVLKKKKRKMIMLLTLSLKRLTVKTNCDIIIL